MVGYSDTNPPRTCGNGHRLGPNRVLVGTVQCECAPGRRREHRCWQCRVCGHLTFADGHTDDTLIRSHLPAFSDAVRIRPEN